MSVSRLKYFAALIIVLVVAICLVWAHSRRASAGASQLTTQDTLAASVVKELQVKIPLWLKERDVPGAAVAVVDDRRILWQEVYGYTTRKKEKPVTPRTLRSL